VATRLRIAALLVTALGGLYFLLAWSPEHPDGGLFDTAPLETHPPEESSKSVERPGPDTSSEPPARESSASDQPEPQRSTQPGRTRPNILAALGARLPPIVSPDWADEMEARILDHMALYPNVSVNSLQVQCQEEACIVLIQADHTIDPFQFEFDRFAEANGFKSAVISTTLYDARIITLRRH
jgi:hypothetical protein